MLYRCYTVIKLLYVIIVILYNDILLRLCRDCSTSQRMQGRPCWPWRNPDLNGTASAGSTGSTGWARALIGFGGPYLPQTWSNIQCITFEHHFAHQAMKYSNGIVDYFDLFTWISREDFSFPPLWHPDHKNCSKSFPRPAQLSILPLRSWVFRQSISQFASPKCIDSQLIPLRSPEYWRCQTGRASDWSQWSGHRLASPIWSHGCHSEAIDVGTQKASKTCWKHAENGMIKFSNHSNWTLKKHLDPLWGASTSDDRKILWMPSGSTKNRPKIQRSVLQSWDFHVRRDSAPISGGYSMV